LELTGIKEAAIILYVTVRQIIYAIQFKETKDGVGLISPVSFPGRVRCYNLQKNEIMHW